MKVVRFNKILMEVRSEDDADGMSHVLEKMALMKMVPRKEMLLNCHVLYENRHWHTAWAQMLASWIPSFYVDH